MTMIYLTKIFTREDRPVLKTRLDLDAVKAAFPDFLLPEDCFLDIDYLDDPDVLDGLFDVREPAPQNFIVRFEHFHPIWTVPYLIHTNMELALMLDGVKPLAVFADVPDGLFLDSLTAAFAPFVAQKRIDRHEDRRSLIDHRGQTLIMVDLFYTLPGEEWRVSLYRHLLATARQGGWNEVCEQIQGLLLGYRLEDVVWWSSHGWWRPGEAPRSGMPERSAAEDTP